MGLIRKEHLEDGTLLGLWHAQESPEVLQDQLQDDLVREEVRQFPLEIRRKQWLAARLLVRTLLEQPVRVVYDRFRKPHLEGMAHGLSITHCGEWVAVTMHPEHAVGVDLEAMRPRIMDLRHKFLSAPESADVADGAVEKMHVYWGAKEVLYKIYGRKQLIFAEHLLITPFQYQTAGRITGRICINQRQESYMLRYENLDGLMLVYSVNS